MADNDRAPSPGEAAPRTVFYRGRQLGSREFARMQRLIEARPGLTREALAWEVARRFRWRRPTGELAVMSCRLLLLRLGRRGFIRLAGPQGRDPAAAPRRPATVPAEGLAAWGPRAAPAVVTGPLVVRPIVPAEAPAWREALARYHYLGGQPLVGESLRYAAFVGDTVVALLAWGAAALHNPPRDRYVGWDAATRRGRLPWVVNNVRFLILPWIQVPHLASRILAANLRRLGRDWAARFGHPVLLAETFVDRARFRGTCYRASNWVYVGDTHGFARRGVRYEHHGQPKMVFLYPLARRARERLGAPDRPTEPQPPEGPPMVKLALSRLPLEGRGGLIDVLQGLADPRHRRGIRHSMVSIMAIAVCATLAGAQSLMAMAHWAQDQPPRTLRRLRCRTGRAPSETTLRRVLGQIDVAALDQQVGAWLAQQTTLAGQGLALDGKTLRGSRDGATKAVHLVGAVLHHDGVVVAQQRVPDKTNEITSVDPLFATLPIAGAVVTGDAMFAQKAIATHLVEAKHADYVFTVKDNQPTLRQDIVDLQLGAFPPSAHDGR
ncbi:MAG: ISAs1 family transposase [Gemmatimonadales bacterium]